WENHIAGACPPKYNRFSRRREFRSGVCADLRAEVRVPVLGWEEEVQSQPIVRLSAHVSYSYFHFTLADHVFEIACNAAVRDAVRVAATTGDTDKAEKQGKNSFGQSGSYKLKRLDVKIEDGEAIAKAKVEIPILFMTSKPITYERSEEHTSELQSRENLVC